MNLTATTKWAQQHPLCHKNRNITTPSLTQKQKYYNTSLTQHSYWYGNTSITTLSATTNLTTTIPTLLQRPQYYNSHTATRTSPQQHLNWYNNFSNTTTILLQNHCSCILNTTTPSLPQHPNCYNNLNTKATLTLQYPLYYKTDHYNHTISQLITINTTNFWLL